MQIVIIVSFFPQRVWLFIFMLINFIIIVALNLFKENFYLSLHLLPSLHHSQFFQRLTKCFFLQVLLSIFQFRIVIWLPNLHEFASIVQCHLFLDGLKIYKESRDK